MLRKGNYLFRYTLLPLFVNCLRAVRSDAASFSFLKGAVVREGVFPNSRMLSCRGRGHSHSVCGRASRGLSGAQRLVGVAAEEWLKGYGCHWSLQRCVVRFLLVDTLDIFNSDLRVRHLLGRPWSCRRIHM
ncbi:mucin-associated surface protein (MASP) [Trypanosoma cruzi]|nr:mucin-associated surface protein (MASP) [Trypanosoma cruzi]